MWERSQRHNPLSIRYQRYKDHRPYLPQDHTGDWLSGRHSDFGLIYYVLKVGRRRRYLLSNNIPAADRVKLQKLVETQEHFLKKFKYFSIIPGALLSGLIFKLTRMPYKILYPLTVYIMYRFSYGAMGTYSNYFFSDNLSYFYYKYSHLATNNMGEIHDPRRKFFRLDTNSYYRQTPDEILHGGHNGDDSGHGGDHGDHHDTSTYYGPYPVNYLYNL
jgi:hypothetical protein